MRILTLHNSRPALLSAGLFALFVVTLIAFPRWTVDDAYITLRYAQNLAQGHGLVYNPGERVEGYTGILWTLLAAGAIWAHLPPLVVLDLVGLVSTLAMLGLVDQILIVLDTDLPRRLLARGLLIIAGWWAMHAMSGLETMLYTALLISSVLAYLRRWAGLPVLVLLCALTRPEGALLTVALGAASWWRGDRRIIPWMAGFVLPGAAYFVWRWSYYGNLLPNTFYVKGAGGQNSWLHVVNFAALGVMPLVLAWRASRPDCGRLDAQRPLLISLGAFIGLLTLFYGQSELMMNYANRFFVPFQPLIIIALAGSWGTIRIRSFPLSSYAILAGIYMLGAGINAYYYELMERQEHAAAARWIAAHAPANATLMVVVDAGMVPYETGLRTIDAGGLNDVYLAHERDPQARANYLLEQEPEVVLLATGDLGISAAEATRQVMIRDPRWTGGYHLAQTFRRQIQFDYHQEVWIRNGTSLR